MKKVIFAVILIAGMASCGEDPLSEIAPDKECPYVRDEPTDPKTEVEEPINLGDPRANDPQICDLPGDILIPLSE